MGNKEDWEEIEKWDRERNEANKLKYGIDLSNMGKEEAKVKKFVKVLNNTGKGLKVLGIIILVIVVLIVCFILNIVLSNMRNSFYIDVKKDIETLKWVKIELISKDVVEVPGYKNENGTYYFRIKKKPEIEFTVTKYWGSSANDYDSNLQKYLFENWNSNNKQYFETEEYIDEDGLLHYSNYISVLELEELDQATELVLEFLKYAEEWNKENKVADYKFQKEGQFCVAPVGSTYIKLNDKVVFLYSGLYDTADKIRENVENFKRDYKEINN